LFQVLMVRPVENALSHRKPRFVNGPHIEFLYQPFIAEKGRK
jgi:hypothetical protein